jgi:hypothetical protein
VEHRKTGTHERTMKDCLRDPHAPKADVTEKIDNSPTRIAKRSQPTQRQARHRRRSDGIGHAQPENCVPTKGGVTTGDVRYRPALLARKPPSEDQSISAIPATVASVK